MEKGSEAGQGGREWWDCLGDLWRLGGLWAVTVAEPVFAALRANPEVLMARPGSPARAALLLVFCLSLAAPLLLGGLVLVSRLAGRGAYAFVYRTAMGLLAAALILQLMLVWNSDLVWGALAIALAVGGIVWLWVRGPALRTMANVLGVALVAVPAVFLASPRLADLWRGSAMAATDVDLARTPPPVVYVLFDEFQLASLLDADGRINPALYPNLAAFAGEATWYRNARSVSSGTVSAVPAALTGRMPGDDNPVPTVVNYPDNLFTRLGTAMPMHVEETLTRLCPASLCAPQATSLMGQGAGLLADAAAIYLHRQLPRPWRGWVPEIDNAWGGFWGPGTVFFPGGWLDAAHRAITADRGAQFEHWLADIEPGAGLNFLHAPLPHVPLVHYPDGRRYPYAGLYNAPDQAAVTDEFAVLRAYQRHVLQTVYVDRLVGELVAHLRERGIYDRALVVLAADHGVYYGPGIKRRAITPDTADDVLRVPLLIKYPGQATPAMDDRLAYTIDIVPTILDVAGAPLPDGAEGRSLDTGQPRTDPLPAMDSQGEWYPAPLKAGLDGAFEPAGGIPRLSHAGQVADLYRVGRHAGLVNRPVNELNVADTPAPDKAIWLRDEAALFEAPYDTDEVPGFILGIYRPDHGRIHAALALDGEVVAVTRSYFTDKGKNRFRFLVPPEVFVRPIGRVRIFRIDSGPDGQALLHPVYDRSSAP